MPIELKMPALSTTMEKGTLTKWLVKPGDAIKPGDILAEIETEKAAMEIEAVDEGVFQRIVVEEGTDAVPVDTLIALIEEDGEAAEASSAPVLEVGTASVPTEATTVVTTPAPRVAPKPAAPGHDPLPAIRQRMADGSKASPLAARLSEALGIDLSTVRGSGPEGRVVRADLRLAPIEVSAPILATASKIDTSPLRSALPASTPEGIPIDTVKLSEMRKTIARRLAESKQTVPHIYLTIDIRLDALLALRARLNNELAARSIKLSVNDMIIRAHALALIACPEVNVQFAGDSLHRFARADISVAVSIEGGLITPIIAGANLKSLSAISVEMKDLAARARDGKLKPEEYQGGTASLSNLGMFGIRQFDAVINPPQAMVLAVGQAEDRLLPVGGQPTVATVMAATGSFDHRAIDGADAARFMQSLRETIENPLALLA